jgi:hypothetical protein
MVVFDLDGTLANTNSLPEGHRIPYQVLEPGIDPRKFSESGSQADYQLAKNWSFGPEVSKTLESLICSGYIVAIATRAPLAYSSTLVHLLELSTQILKASCGPGDHDKAQVILKLAKQFDFQPREVLYVGDLEADENIAGLVGCRFMSAQEFHNGNLLDDLTPYLPRRANGDYLDLSDPVNEVLLNHNFEHEALQDAVVASIKAGIPDSDLHSFLLREMNKSDLVDANRLSGLALFSLLARPGSSSRRHWQDILFEYIEQDSILCLIEGGKGLFQFDSRIATRKECQKDPIQYMQALRRCFPGEHLGLESDQSVVSLHAAFKFSLETESLGSYLSTAKNYKKFAGSGPSVQLGYLNFVADILTSYVADIECDPELTAVVPVPSSAFSSRNVGQVSLRLALAIGHELGLPVFPIVEKTSKKGQFGFVDHIDLRAHLDQVRSMSTVILVEDQSTTGQSISNVAKLLNAQGIKVRHAVAYSSSLVGSTSKTSGTRITCRFRDISSLTGISCCCGYHD